MGWLWGNIVKDRLRLSPWFCIQLCGCDVTCTSMVFFCFVSGWWTRWITTLWTGSGTRATWMSCGSNGLEAAVGRTRSAQTPLTPWMMHRTLELLWTVATELCQSDPTHQSQVLMTRMCGLLPLKVMKHRGSQTFQARTTGRDFSCLLTRNCLKVFHIFYTTINVKLQNPLLVLYCLQTRLIILPQQDERLLLLCPKLFVFSRSSRRDPHDAAGRWVPAAWKGGNDKRHPLRVQHAILHSEPQGTTQVRLSRGMSNHIWKMFCKDWRSWAADLLWTSF